MKYRTQIALFASRNSTLLMCLCCSVMLTVSCKDESIKNSSEKKIEEDSKEDSLQLLISIGNLPSPEVWVISDSIFSFTELVETHFMDSIVDREIEVYYQLKSGRYLPIVLGPKAGVAIFTPVPTCYIQVLDSTHFLYGDGTAIDQKIDFNAFFDDEKGCLLMNNLSILDNYGEKMNWGGIFEDLVKGFDSFKSNNADFTKIPKIIIEHNFTFLGPLTPPIP